MKWVRHNHHQGNYYPSQEGSQLALPDAWGDFVKEHAEVALSVMIRIAADKMLAKGIGVSLASVATNCLLNGLNPVDADAIFSLRSLCQ